MTKDDLVKTCSDQKFWEWITSKSLIKYERTPVKEGFLKELFKQIQKRNYYPKPPNEYLTINKGNGVIRIVPVLNIEDLCVYYYCVRKLEQYIAVNYVSGTFGGFGLSGKLKHVEEENLNKFLDELEILEYDEKSYVFNVAAESPVLSSFSPKAWTAEWSDFTKKLYFHSGDFLSGYVAELDISNFYDSIQLDNLEFKLRMHITHKQNEVIYLLMHFLRFWNRHANFYRQQGAGIPQDLFGECSRILANFYLQGYDKRISSYCNSKNGKFFRYADDQILFAKDKHTLEEMIAKASSMLMKEGLNFNQKKVKIMPVKEFRRYYSFSNFLALTPKKGKALNPATIEKEINTYLKSKSKLRKNGFSFLKRLLTVLLKTKKKPKNFTLLKDHLVSEEFLLNTQLQFSDLTRIYNLITSREKARMFKILNGTVAYCLYTERLYALKLSFASIGKPTKNVSSRILTLKHFYNFEK